MTAASPIARLDEPSALKRRRLSTNRVDDLSCDSGPPSDAVLQLLDGSDDLIECGDAIHSIWRRALDLASSKPQVAITLSDDLVRLCDERFLAYNFKEVPTCWRRLYTDASVLGATARLRMTPDQRVDWLDAIRRLDMAIIVAGAPGEGRSDAIQQLISHIQTVHLAEPVSATLKTSTSTSNEAPAVANPIRRLDALPDLPTLLKLQCEEPFILTGGVSHWPAVERWASTDYLCSIAGRGRVVPVELGRSYTERDWSQAIMPLNEVLNRIRGMQDDQSPPLYLAQHDLFKQFPKLRDDIDIPDLVYTAPMSPPDDYAPPDTPDGFSLNAWVGPATASTPAHTDPYFNAYAQVVGRKWVWLAPPSCSEAMHPFGGSDGDGQDEDDADLASAYMSNTSRIDVRKTAVELDDERYRRFREEVVRVARQAVLGPGDLLCLPPGWWHAMASIEPSCSVSIWY